MPTSHFFARVVSSSSTPRLRTLRAVAKIGRAVFALRRQCSLANTQAASAQHEDVLALVHEAGEFGGFGLIWSATLRHWVFATWALPWPKAIAMKAETTRQLMAEARMRGLHDRRHAAHCIKARAPVDFR